MYIYIYMYVYIYIYIYIYIFLYMYIYICMSVYACLYVYIYTYTYTYMYTPPSIEPFLNISLICGCLCAVARRPLEPTKNGINVGLQILVLDPAQCALRRCESRAGGSIGIAHSLSLKWRRGWANSCRDLAFTTHKTRGSKSREGTSIWLIRKRTGNSSRDTVRFLFASPLCVFLLLSCCVPSFYFPTVCL